MATESESTLPASETREIVEMDEMEEDNSATSEELIIETTEADIQGVETEEQPRRFKKQRAHANGSRGAQRDGKDYPTPGEGWQTPEARRIAGMDGTHASRRIWAPRGLPKFPRPSRPAVPMVRTTRQATIALRGKMAQDVLNRLTRRERACDHCVSNPEDRQEECFGCKRRELSLLQGVGLQRFKERAARDGERSGARNGGSRPRGGLAQR